MPASVRTHPSITISAFAGTRSGTVRAGTMGMPRPLRKPAMRSSEIPGGSGAVAA